VTVIVGETSSEVLNIVDTEMLKELATPWWALLDGLFKV
jgi:hypothetical protein